MTKQVRSWLLAGLVLTAVLVGVGRAYRRPSALPAATPTPTPQRGSAAQPTRSAAAGAASGLTGLAAARAKARSKTPAAGPRLRGATVAPAPAGAAGKEVPKDPQIKALDDLLDNNDNAAALAQARKMTSSSDVAVRAAAVDALRWLGGKEAANALGDMLNDADPDIAAAATDGLLSVLGELDDPALAAALLEKAIPKAAQGGTAEALFISLSGLPEKTSVPVLLDLLESHVPRVSALAKEYLEFVSGGQEITTRAQGEAWLREHEKAGTDAENN
jgi:hypothetical protein